jgi:predicted HTH transcriptional regulator
MELLIGLVVGFLIGRYGFGRFTTNWRKPDGVEAINAGRHQHKEESLERIMGLFEHHDSVANNQVENLLGVSDTTATNYLDELERRGLIVQVGVEGRGVTYRRSDRDGSK